MMMYHDVTHHSFDWICKTNFFLGGTQNEKEKINKVDTILNNHIDRSKNIVNVKLYLFKSKHI
jgi:hypothetical protein